jgi:hypothetical protein
MVNPTKLLSLDEIQKLLAKLPSDVKLDIVQFGLDLMGLVNPAADAASAAISLWRGDFFGAAISAISIIPIGDVLKVAKLGKYAKTFETLVTRIVPNNPALYKELTPMMEQFRSVLAKIPSGNASVEKIREMVTRFFKNAELHRLSSGAKTLQHWAQFAKKRGRWKDPAFAKHGTSPSDVVDKLLSAAESGGHPSLRMNAKEMVEQMGQKDWVISAGPHKTTATAGGSLDRTPHITLEIAGQPHAFHVRLDNKGNIWEITTMKRVDGKLQLSNPVPGTPRPWKGPGQ